MSEVRDDGRAEPPRVRGQGRRLRGAIPHVRPGAAARRSNPTPEARGGQEEQPHIQGVVAVQAQEGLEELSHVEGRKGSGEEIHFIQGKEQQLCFAGVAVKRYPTPKVRETQVRWLVLQEGIRGQTY